MSEVLAGIRAFWHRAWEPEWAGGWEGVRWLWLLAALLTHAPRVRYIPDSYAAQDMVFTRGFMAVADYVVIDAPAGYALWTLGMMGLLMVALGGRWTKPGALVFLAGAYTLASHEALNTKAYDRLLVWETMALLLSPLGERNLTKKWRSPFGRWVMLIVFMAIYGSTGWLKMLDEPHWFDGTALAYHLVDLHFGHTALGAWLSQHLWITLAMGISTIAFEAFFPILVLVRRTNPWVLVAGFGFHLGIMALMHVGTFSFVAVAGYPVLLRPDIARSWYRRAHAWLAGKRSSAAI
ncbi:MAG: HTTM domain-containing protein [Myxococcota bacterium]|nr:HTTM domain-containing protein [Myxococcota bacterium]MEC8423147.1 HTTM domain-containing protein [Myxococcota bacterium]